MQTPHVAIQCPIAYGVYEAADTTRGISIDTSKLGNAYYVNDVIDRNPGSTTSYVSATPRKVRLVKNASSSTLSRHMAVSYGTAAGDFLKNITALASANAQVAGFVEDGYIDGVPDGAIFRLVEVGFHYAQLYGSSDTQNTTAPGTALVSAGSGKVYGQDTAVAAGSATFGQTNGVCGYSAAVTTQGTDENAKFLVYVQSIYR